LAAAAIEHLIEQALSDEPTSAMVGLRHGRVSFSPLADFPRHADRKARRNRHAGWWMALRPIADTVALATEPTRAVTSAAVAAQHD
jgi:hypothetical protein